jgi:hypothetical protein
MRNLHEFDEMLNTIIEKTAGSEKHPDKLTVVIIDRKAEVVAKINKTIYRHL